MIRPVPFRRAASLRVALPLAGLLSLAAVGPFAFAQDEPPAPAEPAAADLAADPAKAARQKLYLEFLADEGYRPKVNDDGDVEFKKEGGLYIITVDEKDAEFFQLTYPGFWPIESDEERLRVFEAAGATTREVKVAKVFVVEENVSATVETLVAKPEDFEAVFPRALELVEFGVSTFVEQMEASAPAAAVPTDE